MASSALVDWPFVETNTDQQLRRILGPNLYTSLAAHVANLQPQKLLDEAWLQREFLQTLVFGIGLFKEQYGSYLPIIHVASRVMPTSLFLKTLRGLDYTLASSRASRWLVDEIHGATSN